MGNLSALLKHRFPEGARVLEGGADRGAPSEAYRQRVKIRLPKDIMPISALFRDVEAHRDELEIAEYSISETTLDQIFISFARQQEGQEGAAADSAGLALTFGLGRSFDSSTAGH